MFKILGSEKDDKLDRRNLSCEVLMMIADLKINQAKELNEVFNNLIQLSASQLALQTQLSTLAAKIATSPSGNIFFELTNQTLASGPVVVVGPFTVPMSYMMYFSISIEGLDSGGATVFCEVVWTNLSGSTNQSVSMNMNNPPGTTQINGGSQVTMAIGTTLTLQITPSQALISGSFRVCIQLQRIM